MTSVQHQHSPERPWTHAVFDCDGLLVDTRACWHAAFAEAAALAGGTLSSADLTTLNGASVASAAALLTRRFGRETNESALRDALREAVLASPHVAMPGARTLLDAMRDADFGLMVATNGPRDVVEHALDRIGLGPYFADVVSAEDIGAGKPDPAVYREACRRMGADPLRTIAFEDSRVGVASARAAGLFVVGVPSGSQPLEADVLATRLDEPELLRLLGFAEPLLAGEPADGET